MTPTIQLLNIVALTTDLAEKGLQRGQLGTVVLVFVPIRNGILGIG